MGNDKVLHGRKKGFLKDSSIYRPSDFWIKLNDIHQKQLMLAGFKNFKRSINMKYFNWSTLGILAHQGHLIINQIKRGNWQPIFKSNFFNYKSKSRSAVYRFNPISAFIYKTFVAAYMDYLQGVDKQNIFKKISEPKIGNPFLISYRDKKISQDLCNSVHEFYSITNPLEKTKKLRILEIGAGYGRLGYIFLNQLRDCSYCIIDIPPALFVAQKYLTKVFPREKFFHFRSFNSFKKVKKEFESARISFLNADRIELLPDNYFDLVINVSSLHEMTREQINNYFRQINRICRGYFYTKQWRKSRTSDNNYISEGDYPRHARWNTIFQRQHPIQKMFFEALYKIL
ncbi:putative sugar O-methyltransferase [Candidatus Daviesbacteria bacterium]|nr:putative sugar O-methyltransferase [Candidatus Daviesbacteria bacterium]